MYCVQAIIIQPCPLMMPTHSMDAAAAASAAGGGGGVTEPGHGLASPAVYAGGPAPLEPSSSTAALDSESAAAATSTVSIPPPIAILAPVDQRAAACGGGAVQTEASGSAAAGATSSRPAPQQGVCQLVQPSPQGLVQEPGSLVSPAGGAVYGSGAQMIAQADNTAAAAAAAVQSQVVQDYRHRRTVETLETRENGKNVEK